MFSWFTGSKKEPEKPKEPITSPNDIFFCRPKLNPNFQYPKFLTSDETAKPHRPPAVIKTFEKRLEELTQKEKEAFERMCKILGEEIVKEQTGWGVLRYLVARNFDVDASVVLMKSTIEWRKTLPSTCKWCTEDPGNHMAEFVGWDKQHRPVIYMTYRYALERGDMKASEHHMCSTFDHAIRMMPEGVTQWVTMVDFAGFSVLRDSSPSVAKHILKILADHYPERLGTFILVNPIKGTWILWKMLGPLLDEKTKGKVRFAYSSGTPKLTDTFDDLFPDTLATWLTARYSENYQDLPLGALDGKTEKEIAAASAAAAAAAQKGDEQAQAHVQATCTLEEANVASPTTGEPEQQNKKEEEGEVKK